MNLGVLKRFLRSKINLEREESVQETYQEIVQASDFSGFSIWITAFAMLIACIGLNTNSTSAIIGAMLISPLMGPVTGYAFALAINDKGLKNKALRNFFWMTLISLTASTIFFLISPFDNNTDALKSFSKASIFDIMIAFFGGMAGFIGILRKDGVKVMAGVAVATACMPPLCTAGFGLAHADWYEFAGGLYFYAINSLFIGLATFMLTRISGIYTYFVQRVQIEKIASWLWILFIVLMILPGVYIAWQKWNLEKQSSNIPTTERQRIELLEKKVQHLDSLLNTNKP